MSDLSTRLANDVLAFWFGDALQRDAADTEGAKRWFTFDASFDTEILQRFGHLPEQAAAGNLDSWMDAAETALARVIVLDQFPRNLYRHDSRAFAFDKLASAGTQAAIERGFDAELHPLQAVFMYLPFEHAEDIDKQERAVVLFEALEKRAPTGAESRFARFTDFARRHRDVIARFGRFPHRNTMLCRTSTAEELQYLAQGGERFGPKPTAP
jgi:uncharacterized protein (DUF924 family)